jgi:RNA polymerase sigma factor (TIGR02999 family)
MRDPGAITPPHDDAEDLDATLRPQVYQRLRELARRQLAGERAAQTLDTTALVHETWLNLAGGAHGFADRAHFYAYAATAMRHILVDHARRRMARKRGGNEAPLDLDAIEIPSEHAAAEMLALNEALERLDALEPRLARVVELRFFAGLSVEETAEALGIVARSVVRDWARARVFLQQAIE